MLGSRRRSAAAAIGALLGALLSALPGSHVAAAGDVTVYRDNYGVPHIEAQSLQGLAYATGYLTAKDRLFEMDIIRRLAQGRLAEIVGPSQLASDRYTRREFLLTANIKGQYQALPATARSMFQAYSDGVNQGAIETLSDPRTRPALFDALADVWRPWTPEDSVSVDMLFTMVTFGGEGASGQLDNARLLADLEQRYGHDEGVRAFNDLVPATYSDAPTVIPPGEGPPSPGPAAGYSVTAVPPAQEQLATLPGLAAVTAAHDDELATIRAALASNHIPVPRIGSYAAALAGWRTASHGGLLLGSPQSGLLSPPIFYELGWHIPGVTDCEGFTVPGLGPAIGIGWCNQHVWTLVAGNMGDQADLYVEKLDPNNPHRYWFEGAWHDTVQRSTTYIVASTAECATGGLPAGPCPPQVLTETYDYTVHGPIFAVDKQANVGLAYRRAQTGVFLRSLLGSAGWNLSKDRAGFMDGTDGFTATYNLLYADSDGHITYRFTGLQPVRAGTDRRLPISGTGDAEWRGFLTQCQMPHDSDPSTGYFAINQGTESKPIDWWPNSAGVAVGPVSRVALDQQLLAGTHGATMSSLAALDRPYIESRDPYAALFYPLFHHALASSSDARLHAALSLLDAWRATDYARTSSKGDGLEDHPGLAIFELDNLSYAQGFQHSLGDALIHATFDAPTDGLLAKTGTYQGQLAAVYEALRGSTVHAFVSDPDHLIQTTVSSVLDNLTKQYGTADMSSWHEQFPKQSFMALGIQGPQPVKGMDHGSYSQVVDTGAASGENVEPPGNIANDSVYELANPPAHWNDQRQLYEDYSFKPMRLTKAMYSANPEQVISLQVGDKYGSDTTLDYRSARDRCHRGAALLHADSAAGDAIAADDPGALVAVPNTAGAPGASAGNIALLASVWLVVCLVGFTARRRRRTHPTRAGTR